jgi:hypothetical protein
MQWRLSSAIPLILSVFAPTLLAATAEPTADEIISHAVERARENQAARLACEYDYRKVSTTEVLDGRGRVTDRKEKVYLVQAGKAYLQRMRRNGEEASAQELEKEERWMSETRKEVTESKSSHRDENWEKFLTQDLVARYDFALAGAEMINGRPAYIITFLPRAGDLPVRKMADRVLNRLTGRIWVDQQEFEIAKASIALQSPATLGGLLKIVGSLRRLDFTVERVRVAENVWFNRTASGDFESRKLWDSTHMRTLTHASGFQISDPVASDE